MASKNQILNRSESEYDLDIGDYANFQLKFTKDRPSSRQGSVQSDDRDGRFSLKDKSANPTDQDEKSLYDIDSKSDNEVRVWVDIWYIRDILYRPIDMIMAHCLICMKNQYLQVVVESLLSPAMIPLTS